MLEDPTTDALEILIASLLTACLFLSYRTLCPPTTHNNKRRETLAMTLYSKYDMF
jgi:hypothetical protein